MNNKIYCGSGKVRTSDYGEFYTIGVKLKELEKYTNEKGYVNLVITKKKEPDNYGNDLSVSINDYKPKQENIKQATQKTEEISVDDIPW